MDLSSSEEPQTVPIFNSLWEADEFSSIEVLQQSSHKFGKLTVKDLDWWKQIGRSIYQITPMTEKSTHGEMRQILSFYTLLNQNGKLHEDGVNRYKEIYLADEKVFDFFMNTFFQECAQYLIDERTFHLQDTLDLSNQILLQSVYLFLTTFNHTTPSMIQMLSYIFNSRKHYFSANNRVQLPFHIQSLFGRSKEEQTFLENLTIGQEVDALKIDTNQNKTTWSRAVIEEFSGDHVYLKFRHSSLQFNRSVQRYGYEIREKGTQLSDEDFNWRLDLKEGDQVDCCDTSQVFYNSTILQVKELQDTPESESYKQVFVGYRIYEENGQKKDAKGTFNGWSSQFDEWLDATHPRIQKFQSVAKKLYFKASSPGQEEHIDDFNNLVQTLTSKETVYACHQRTSCQSLFQLVAINKFGRLGGFDLMLKKIQGGFDGVSEWCPIDSLACMMLIISNVQPNLHKSFAMSYGAQVIESVKRSILDSPNSNLRNFTKEKIDLVTNGLSSLMLRVYSIGQKNEMLEKFNLQMALQSFNSDFIKTQLQGLKTIMEVLSQQRNERTTNLLSLSDLRSWIEDNKVFVKLFTSSKYQLIAKAGDLFKFMLNESMIEPQHLEILWSQTKKDDTELKLAIFKILTDTSFLQVFDQSITEFFVNKIVETNPIEIGSEDIEMMSTLTRYKTKSNGDLQEQVRLFYWKLIENSSDISPKISEEALKNYCDSFTFNSDKQTIKSLFERCLTQIEAGSKSSQSLLKIIIKVVEPLYTTDINSLSKKEALLYLFEEKKILSILVTNIRSVKQSLLSRIPADTTTITEQILDPLMPRGTYIEFIQQRIDFHTFIFQQLPKSIDVKLEVFHEIWDTLVIDALVPREKDMLYKWFSELIANSMNANSTQVDKDDLAHFFSEKLCSDDDLRGMTLEGIVCFKSIFCILNEKDKRMKKVKVLSAQTQSYMSQYTTMQPEPEIRTNLDFDYVMHDIPGNLIGIESLWKIISLNLDEGVTAIALEFLNNLHTNFDSSIVSESEADIKKKYYQQAYEYLEKQIEGGADSSRVKRCIMLMESILDESEKLGNGGLKSLMSLSKGELITLHFTTTFFSPDFSNNFSFKIYSNDSLIELLYQVGLRIQCTYEEVVLSFSQPKKEIEPKENGKSLSELRLKNGEKLLVSMKKGSPVKEEELIINNEANPKAVTIFKRWFNTFAIDGQMKAAQIAKFINSCTHDNCQENDARVEGSLDQYDSGKKGYLNEEDFINFYTTACRHKPDIVRKNVATHGYRKDLRRFDEITIQSIDFKAMPRYILARDQKFFQMIFELLDRKEVASDTWRFLSRLPISPVVYEKIVRLESIRDASEANWESVLGGDSKYKQLYNLHVIEYLMEEQGESSSSASASQIVSNESEELKAYKENWRTDFIRLGGFDYLIKNFKELLAKSDGEAMDTFSKKILSFILKIVQNYLVATFSCIDSSIYKSIARMTLTQVPLSALLLSIREDTRTLGLRRKESEARETLIEMELKRMETADEGSSNMKSGNNSRQNYEAKVEESQLFLHLQASLQSQGLADILLSKFDFPQLTESLSSLCLRLVKSDVELESEDRVIIEYSLLIISTILVHFEDTAATIMSASSHSFDDLVQACIFYKDNQNIRKIFSHCFFMVGQSHLSLRQNEFPIHRLVDILMANIPGLHNTNQNCAQYFELFCALLDSLAYHQIDSSSSSDWLDLSVLLRKLIQSLKNHESTETEMQSKPDKIQIGIMNLCDRILSFKEALKEEMGSAGELNLIEEIFHKCLFYLDDPNKIESESLKKIDKSIVKCKTEASRAAAFRLLTTLCRNCPSNLEMLMERGLTELMTKIPTESVGISSFNRGEPKSDFGYVGLRNLGCICYMNAMLQQFFMTPTFRYAILMAQDGVEENRVTDVYNKTRINVDDNVLHQFQQMFAFLEMSSRVDYNPIEFCFSFKDYGGEPVNTIVQQDAQEFLNMIFDKLENGLKQTPFKKILENVYGGKTCSQLICSNCKQVNNRYEQFYNLSVEVKNSNSLIESFERFIAGETISDFKCEACQKKVDVRKRVCLSELPNVLIVHLQRIIFDLETLTNIKVNSRLEFPQELDLRPFTKSHLEQTEAAQVAQNQQDGNEGANGEQNEQSEEQESPLKSDANSNQSTLYKLAGVVVHTGTAEYGHYYSYIDSARGFSDLGQPIKESWLEFNDSRVRDFSTKNLENECFGGQQNDNDDNNSGSLGFNFGWFRNRDNSKNAYILVYERIEKNPIELVFDTAEQRVETMTALNLKSTVQQTQGEQQQDQKITALVDYFDFHKYVPDNFYKKVWTDNHTFMFEKHISHKSFFSFLHEIANSIDVPVLNDEICAQGYYADYLSIDSQTRESYFKLMKMHVQMIYHLTNISAQSSTIEVMITKLFSLLKLCPDKCKEFFVSTFYGDIYKKEGMIIKSSDNQMRGFLARIYSECLKIIINFYKIPSLIISPEEETSSSPEVFEQLQIKKNLRYFLQVMRGYMQEHALKNAFKSEAYFSFWDHFGNQGTVELEYLLSEDLCSSLIEILMGEDSPFNARREYSMMSSRTYNTKITSLSRCIATLLEKMETPPERLQNYGLDIFGKAKIPSQIDAETKTTKKQMSQNVFKYIHSSHFYEKLFSNDSIEPDVIGRIIKRLATDNLQISLLISDTIIRGVLRAGVDETKIFCEAIYSILSIQDEFRRARIEAVLGVPTLSQNYQSNSSNSIKQQTNSSEEQQLQYTHYGVYCQSSISDAHYNLKSSLQIDISQSALEALYVNKRSSENISGQILLVIIMLANENDDIAEYLALLPSPSYIYSSFVQFMSCFFADYVRDSLTTKSYYFPKATLALALQNHYPEFQRKIDLILSKNNESAQKKPVFSPEESSFPERPVVNDDNIQDELNSATNSTYANGLYTIGRTTEANITRKAQLPLLYKIEEFEELTQFEQTEFENEQAEDEALFGIQQQIGNLTANSRVITVLERDVTAFVTGSEPNGTTNLAYDSTYVKETFISTSMLQSNSPWNAFFKSKYPSAFSTMTTQYEPESIRRIDGRPATPFEIALEEKFDRKECIREYVIINSSYQNAEVKLEFLGLDDSNVNQAILPRYGKYVKVKPRSTEVVYAIAKASLDKEWGKYSVQVSFAIQGVSSDVKSQLQLQSLELSQLLLSNSYNTNQQLFTNSVQTRKILKLSRVCAIDKRDLLQCEGSGNDGSQQQQTNTVNPYEELPQEKQSIENSENSDSDSSLEEQNQQM